MGQVYTSPCASSHRPQRGAAPVDVDAVVIGNRHLSADYNVLALDAPGIADAHATWAVRDDQGVARAGSAAAAAIFVFEILRNAGGQPMGISIFNKRVGVGTSLLSELEAGARAPVPRPARPAVHADRSAGGSLDGGRRRRARAVCHARRSARRAQDADDALLWRAAAPRVLSVDLFEALGVRMVLATEDGSTGVHGRVTVPLEEALRARPLGQPVKLFACGPTPMMRELRAARDRARPRLRRLARTGDGLRPGRLLQLRRRRSHRRRQGAPHAHLHRRPRLRRPARRLGGGVGH